MRAVLLFSAMVHIAALGLLAAYALRSWMDARRPKELAFSEVVTAAAALAGAIVVVATVFLWPARGFGGALITGMVAGALGGVSFLLALGAWPQRPSHGGAASLASQITGRVFVGVFLLLEVVAFCFLASAAGRIGAFA